MNKPAPVFRPISAPLDVPDEALNALGDRLGVPTMKKPEPPPAPKHVGTPASAAAEALRSPAPAGIEREGPSSQEKLTVELPAYLMQAMRRDVAEKRLTQRYIVLQGLHAIGYAIEPGDLVPDHRRPRHKAGQS